VPGSQTSALKPHMEFLAGQPKKLVFRRPSGQEYETTLLKQ
jgi:hypothetical protein